jgi:glycerophosphoryl diester phosphodiesterase
MCTSLKEKISLALMTVFLCGCGGSETGRDISAKAGSIKNIGHAGCGFNYLFGPFNPLPPNSFRSLVTALDLGAGGVEVDLQITSDFQLVLFHDITLESKTGLTGPIHAHTGGEVLGTPYAVGFPYDFFHDEKVIGFTQWIRYAAGLPVVPFLQIDLKTGYGQPTVLRDSMLNILLRELQSVGYPPEKVYPISSDPQIILKLMKMNAQWNCAYETTGFDTGLALAVQHHCRYLILDQKYLDESKVKRAHSQGVGVIAFGGRSRSTLRKIVDMRPDFIQSNHVSRLNDLLNE